MIIMLDLDLLKGLKGFNGLCMLALNGDTGRFSRKHMRPPWKLVKNFTVFTAFNVAQLVTPYQWSEKGVMARSFNGRKPGFHSGNGGFNSPTGQRSPFV